MDNIQIVILVLTMTLSISSWNMRFLRSATPYLQELCGMSDIITASEHRLYQCELFKLQDVLPGYTVQAKASIDLSDDDHGSKPGHCGLLIAWKDNLNACVREIVIDSDRICGIQLIEVGPNKSNILILGVYMPHQQCKSVTLITILMF